MAPKKGKKMDLGAFLADEATGSSWADEMDSFPTAPSGEAVVPGGLGGSHLRGGGYGGQSGGYGDRGGAGDYGDRPMRAEVPFPTAPPYTAFVGNLTFEYGEADIQQFFTGINTTSVRMVNGMDGKPKGFCYVEFAAADDLRNALAMSGQDAGGRAVRITVAEPPKGREGRADEDMTWERQGPLAPLPGRGGCSFGGGREGGPGGFDRPRDNGFGGSGEGGDRDFSRASFGSKFVPSVDAPRRTGGYERAGPGGSSYDRSGVGAPEEDRGERGGFGSKFVPAAPAPARPAFGDRRSSGAPGEGRADEEKTWSRQGPLAPLAGARGPRTGGFGDAPRASFGDAPPSDSAGPPRRRLELSARSAPSADSTPSSSPAPTRPSPFGSARPVDSAAKDSAAEAKLAAERATTAARIAAEKEKKASEPSREDMLAKARAAIVAPTKVEEEKVVAGAEPVAAAAPASAAVLASLRKDGFSYSSIANVKDEELLKQIGETTI